MVTAAKRHKQMKKPQALVDYNDTMSGVDTVDQHLAEYATPTKRGKQVLQKHFFSSLGSCSLEFLHNLHTDGRHKTPSRFSS